MELYLLVTSAMMPIPTGIEVVKDYGHECVIPDLPDVQEALRTQVSGQSMHLSADPQKFVDWLRPYDGIYVCDNLMRSDWQIVHIRPDA